MSVRIRQIDSRADRKKFVRVPWLVYRQDPRWIPPLIVDRLDTIDHKKNPFFEHGQAALFLAEKDGEPVGRITAHRNHLHNEHYGDKAGFFGFYECIRDESVSRALLEAAEGWLRDKGCDKVLGPESFSTNEEVGFLAKGYDKPLMIMCSYNPPYYNDFIQAAGYDKAKDLLGWLYDIGKVPEAAVQIAEAVQKHEGLTLRQVDPGHLKRDIDIVRGIFNAAWSRNWGYVPWTDREVEHAAKMMKMILVPQITAIAEVDGKPAAMMLAFPNILEVQRDLNGRLFPFGLLKLLYRVKMGGHKFRGLRLFLLGVKPEFRGSVLGGLSVLLYIHTHRVTQKLGFETAELGWTLEDNEKINAGITFMGGRNEKVYRIYGKDL